MKNLHKAYYRDYFEGIDFSYLIDPQKASTIADKIKDRNKKLCACGLFKINKNPMVNSVFSLQIVYPGLITGVGIEHEAKIEGEFKLGLHFDYTYGMPVVYGSSVKGVLRNYFKAFCPQETDADDLIHDIFDGEERDYSEEGQRAYKPKSIYNRDVFFDAVLTKPDKKGRILCPDSITPHDRENLKNPIPITFMKIAPGCELEFRFKLVDSKIGEGRYFSADDKKRIFQDILRTVGIGAKTNVGYGQFAPEEGK